MTNYQDYLWGLYTSVISLSFYFSKDYCPKYYIYIRDKPPKPHFQSSMTHLAWDISNTQGHSCSAPPPGNPLLIHYPMFFTVRLFFSVFIKQEFHVGAHTKDNDVCQHFLGLLLVCGIVLPASVGAVCG